MSIQKYFFYITLVTIYVRGGKFCLLYGINNNNNDGYNHNDDDGDGGDDDDERMGMGMGIEEVKWMIMQIIDNKS